MKTVTRISSALFATVAILSGSALIAEAKPQSRCVVIDSDSANEDWCMVEAGKNGEPCYCIYNDGSESRGKIRN